MMEFQGFGKIPRLSKDMIITEKIDGTNAQIYITDDMQIFAGSRTRWVTPGNDNYGFASWVEANKEELLQLGPGRHFGEWWGKGIQRGYGMTERKFSLFNTTRWAENRPACCDVVPELYRGPFNLDMVEDWLDILDDEGSYAAPGFMYPEGVIIYHVAGGYTFKKTVEADDTPKSNLK
jgi:hypothetical protein